MASQRANTRARSIYKYRIVGIRIKRRQISCVFDEYLALVNVRLSQLHFTLFCTLHVHIKRVELNLLAKTSKSSILEQDSFCPSTRTDFKESLRFVFRHRKRSNALSGNVADHQSAISQ